MKTVLTKQEKRQERVKRLVARKSWLFGGMGPRRPMRAPHPDPEVHRQNMEARHQKSVRINKAQGVYA